MEFATLFNHPEPPIQSSGSDYEDEFIEEIGEDGKIQLVKIGEHNVYADHQVDLESTKIENILHAVAMGDLSALQKREAMYVDVTNMPKTLMEAQNIVIKAKQEFYNMPLEVRKEFDNSPEKYVSEMGTQEFLDKMAPYNEKMKNIQEAGNLEAYNKKVAEQAKFEKDVESAKGVATNEQK